MQWFRREPNGIAADSRNVYIAGNLISNIFLAKLKQPNPPPEVRIVRPQNNAVVYGEVEILAEATDDLGVNRVEFTVDGILKKKAIWPPPFACTWDTRGQLNGTHVIRARAYDDEGASADDEITVDVQNLTLTLAAERKEEKAWIIRRRIRQNQPDCLQSGGDSRYAVRAAEESWRWRFSAPAGDIAERNFQRAVFIPGQYLEYGNSYTYRVEARLGSGELAAVSNDISI